MCGRYYIPEDDAPYQLQSIIDALSRRATPVQQGEVCPGGAIPVVANSRSLKPTPFAMHWGYRLGGRLVINARSETADVKPLFADGMARRRCLIPAVCYYEWEQTPQGKRKHAIRPAEGDMFYMAGLYRPEPGGAACTILTRSPAPEIAFIHDRMPVILPQAALADWLDPRFPAVDVLRAAGQPLRHAPA